MAKIILNRSTTDYVGMASYFSYIETRIDNEEKIRTALRESMIKAGAVQEANILLEAGKTEMKLRAKWDRFKGFVKTLSDRFMAALDKILDSNKVYLEKYKDIIINKDTQNSIRYEYNGDYNVGIERIESAKLPPFNEARHGAALRQDGMKPIIDTLFKDTNGMDLDGDTPLAEQFKQYFLAMDKGKQTGDFKNFTKADRQKMYNYCYNVKKLKDDLKAEINTGIEQSTNAINAMARKADQNAGEKTQTNQNTNAQQNTTGNGAKETQNNTEKTANTATNTVANNNNAGGNASKEESGILMNGALQYVYEADNDNDDKPKAGVNIDDTAENRGNSATQNAGNGNAADDKGGNAANTMDRQDGSAADVTNLVNKWTKLCNAYLSGKMTAIEQIARDYMVMLKTHVRSHGGKDIQAENQNQNNENGNNAEGSQNNNQNNNNAGKEANNNG